MTTTAKLLTMIFLLSIFFGLSVGSVLASQKDWYGKVGGVNVHASKWVGLGGYMWSTDLYSGAAQNINIIGYTYWTIGEYCPKTYTWAYWKQYPGDYRATSSYYYTAANVYYRGCNGISRYWSLGKHDFAYGNQHIYPYVSTSEQR